MFNITGGELLLILVMALIVLGPERLPDAARKIGKAVSQLRDLSGSFQKEIRDAFEEPATPVVKPNSRPQLTAIDGGAGEVAATAPLAAAPVDGGESRAVAETEAVAESEAEGVAESEAEGVAEAEGKAGTATGTEAAAGARPAGSEASGGGPSGDPAPDASAEGAASVDGEADRPASEALPVADAAGAVADGAAATAPAPADVRDAPVEPAKGQP